MLWLQPIPKVLVILIFTYTILNYSDGSSWTVESHNLSCHLRPSSVHPKLEKYNVEPFGTTVSGLSNGGSFAIHISFIYSSVIRGAGIFSASPFPMAYLLSEPNPRSLFEVSEYFSYIDDWVRKGWIDSTSNFRNFKAYVYMGRRDYIIHPRIVENVITEYKHYGADVKDMYRRIGAGHCIPTDTRKTNDPFTGKYQGICNVGYAGVADMFSHFYGQQFVKPKNSSSVPTGQLFKSDISEFYPGCYPELQSIGSTAWTYVPKQCDKCTNFPKKCSNNSVAKCKLHFAFHGYALPFRATILADSHNAFVEDAGYLEVADANNVILIFPESKWRGYDIIGYTGPHEFVRKSGVQNLAIKKMIDRITKGL